MNRLLDKNKKHLLGMEYFFPNKEKINEIISYINNNRIAIISGMRYTSKTKIVKLILENSGTLSETWYYNQDLDSMQQINNAMQLNKLYDEYVEENGVPKLIVLENISRIDGIKEFIKEKYEDKNVKLLLLGNDLEIDKVPEITTYPLSYNELSESQKESSLTYGNIEEVNMIENTALKKEYIKLITDSIIYKDIISPYNIKNDKSFLEMLTYLSYNDKEITGRQLHRELSANGGEISLITLGEYLYFALNSKIIHNVEAYDIKNQKAITTRNNYFFTDIGIRNTLSYYSRDIKDNTHNIIASELLKDDYKLHTGVYGRYEFSLIAENDNRKMYIDIINETDTNELEKLGRKMRKAAKYGAAKPYFILTGFKEEGIPKSIETVPCYSLESLLELI